MQDIIILILFTYPGVMADYLHSRMTAGKDFADKTEEYFRIARDFFISALITIASISLFCLLTGTAFSLGAVMNQLQKISRLILYLPISLVFSWDAAVMWKLSNEFLFNRRNKRMKKNGLAVRSPIKRVWASMLSDPDLPKKDCVLAVYQNGQLLRAGMVHETTEDPEEDPWVMLEYTNWAQNDLKLPPEERQFLEGPLMSSVDIKTGMVIDVYDGKKLGAAVDDYFTSLEASEE